VTRYAYQTVWIDRLVPGKGQDAETNPVWETLMDGSYLAPEGSRVVSMQMVERPTIWVKHWVHNEAMMIVLEREHSLESPYR
jgi:hypothetical protein